MAVDKNLTEKQQKILSILPTIGGVISILCCLRLITRVIRSRYARQRLYHRIMAASAASNILQSISVIWGPYAVPAGTPNFIHAQGTIATCSTVGFLSQFTLPLIPSYYFVLCIMAYLCVIHKVQIQKYGGWVEKWIHIVVFIFPIGSAIHCLIVEAYNPVVRSCAVASSPIGCGTQSDDGEVCIRGPQNVGQLQWLYAGLPAVIFILSPTILMIVLYCEVYGRPQAASVAKQSFWFLFVAIYWTYMFLFIDATLIFQTGELVFVANLLSNVMFSLQGLWMLIVYWCFRSEDPSDHQSSDEDKNGGIIRPEFSIFDGTDISNSESPWAQYLNDEGEDDEYEQDDGEYDDTNDFAFSTRIKNENDKAAIRNSSVTVWTENCPEEDVVEENCIEDCSREVKI